MRRVDIQSALRSVVVPAYNEEEVLPEFHKRISVIWDSVRVDGELVLLTTEAQTARRVCCKNYASETRGLRS